MIRAFAGKTGVLLGFNDGLLDVHVDGIADYVRGNNGFGFLLVRGGLKTAGEGVRLGVSGSGSVSKRTQNERKIAPTGPAWG